MRERRTSRTRRNHGTGAIVERYGNYHGQWRVDGKLIQRKLGPVRKPGSKEGLTKAAAEQALRALMAEQVATVTGRVTLEDAGSRLIRHLRTKGRKPSTLEGYRSYLEVHLLDFFGDVPVDKITKTDVETFIEARLRAGQSVQSVRNYLGLLHTILDFSLRRGWVTTNVCKLVEKPEAADVDADIRYLDESEINALLRATLDTELDRVDRAMYMTAAMTGRRQGELLAVRWMDVDWAAQRIRVSPELRSRAVRHAEEQALKPERAARRRPRRRARPTAQDDGLQRRLRPRVRPPTLRASRWSARDCSSATRPRSSGPALGQFGCTTSATPSERAWRQPA